MNSDAPENLIWHREAITPAIEDTLRALHDKAITEGAYLAGGTGLALRFGHRRSADLDFFIREAFSEEMLLQRLQPVRGVSDVTFSGMRIRFSSSRHTSATYRLPIRATSHA